MRGSACACPLDNQEHQLVPGMMGDLWDLVSWALEYVGEEVKKLPCGCHGRGSHGGLWLEYRPLLRCTPMSAMTRAGESRVLYSHITGAYGAGPDGLSWPRWTCTYMSVTEFTTLAGELSRT